MPDDADRTQSNLPTPVEPTADDTELVAYLDGELDDAAAVRVEARLARDPAARAAAEAYKKSFDLLDYLPTAEPKPDFTTRTITRLQPVLVAPAAGPPGSGFVPMLPPRRPVWPELLGWGVAAVLVLVLGYVGHSVARPFQTAPAAADEPTLADLEVIERLPLYLGVDDLAFLSQLDAANLFGEESLPPSVPVTEAPAAEDRSRLIAQFRGLPPARQQQLRVLHQELKAADPKVVATLAPTLDAYAAWLGRLPDGERKKVLSAPTSADRLVEIGHVKEAQWRASLTPGQKELLKNVKSTEDREKLAAEFRQQEFRRREEWELAHRQWQLVSEKGQKPWPFDDPKRVDQIDAYIRDSLGADLSAPPPDRKAFPDPQPHCRLTRDQFVELKTLRDAARKEGNWSWLFYGACLLRLSDAHPSLPVPRDGKPATSFETLPKDYKPHFLSKFPDPKGAIPKLGGGQALVGKWPEYALFIHESTRRVKFGNLSPLGPCKPGEFAPDVTAFIKDPLGVKLSPTDADALRAVEGKWPDYPRKLMELARKHDLSVPGVTLPGEPSKWEKLYRMPSGKK
jgi:hypothetical protein